jgi:hypothetical protein
MHCKANHARGVKIAIALLLLAGSLALFGSPVFLIPAHTPTQRRRKPHRRQPGVFHSAAGAWRRLRGIPRPGWHPCARCRTPIEPPSRARYCSPGCRRFAQLERHAHGGDERAQRQLDRARRAAYDPALAAIPF